jgi:PAS domain S-box-containing protein
VTQSAQALWLNAVPLLVAAPAYLGAAAVLARPLRSRRPGPTRADWTLLVLFLCLALGTAVLGVVLAVEQRLLAGGVWPTLAAALALLAPPLLVVVGGTRPADAEGTPSTRDREFESMAEISAELARANDADTVARLLLGQVERLLGVDVSALALVADDGRTAQGCLLRKDGQELDWFNDVRFDLEHEPSGIATAVFEGGPFAVFDASASTKVSRKLVDAVGAKSTAYVPLIMEERVIAVLVVASTNEPRAFATNELNLLQALAGDAALALARARTTSELADSLERERRQARVGRAFFRIAAVLGHSLSLEATLEAVAHAASDALGGSSAAVLMPRGATLELAGVAEVPAPLADELRHGLPGSARALARAALEGRVLAAGDVADDDRFETDWRELARRAGYRALLAVPVASTREDANGLVLVFFQSPRTFVDEDLELARHLADAARGALERSELFEAERTARRLSQQLARTGGVLATELDPTAVLDEVVNQAPALLAADACAIRTVEDDELVVGAASGDGAEESIGTRVQSSARLSGDVFQSRAPVAVDDAGDDDRLLAVDPILASGYRAFLGVPLTGPEGALHGVLAVYAKRARTWRPEEIEALLALAANTSAALSNAELYSRVSIEKERSVAILANIADGIVAVDRDGEVVLWNAAAEEITGVQTAEALGRTPMQILQRTLESDGTRGPRLVSIMRGSEEVWLSLSEAVMRDPLGEVAGRIFAFRDISADRMVEQVKSDFVAAVSHELRTPLTSIYGFAETLLRQDVLFGDEERRIFIGYIASESERLTEIVDQLLNVARLDAGDLHVEPEPIDVAAVVSEVVETVEELGAVNGHRFEVDLPAEPLAAEADRDKLRQVFNILVENALKYSPQGGTVTVGARRTTDGVEVRVVDQGAGIPVGEQERIFRKFYRAESTGRDGGGGTGLGLFIARELVTAMGGRIWVESAEGEGSSFAFELPVARE